jgi:hypothetical protein
MAMMKKYIYMAVCAFAALPMTAQETYENARLMEQDLNGTARYVGMGGAMEALGADISTISSNPAGIGLFRSSNISGSFGVVSQAEGKDYRTGDKTNFSFDQLGFVYSTRTSRSSFVNVAFNYHKDRNFDYILSAANAHDGRSSQNNLSFIKGIGENDPDGASYFNFENGKGRHWWTSELDNVYYNSYIVDKYGSPYCDVASDYVMNRANTGYIGVYDFNLSGNINNRLYLGLTVGLHDVHYKGVSDYQENIIDADGMPSGNLIVSDEREVTGMGYDVKAGLIVRPFEESAFRIGASVSTPTFYKLTTRNHTYLTNNTSFTESYNPRYVANDSYEFKLYTPWKFGLSMGHTVGTNLALGASFEYADYGTTDTRNITGTYYDEWTNSYSDDSESDKIMNTHTKETLKGVSTLKLGAEFKPTKEISLRAGYNYVSPMYKTDGFKNGFLDSYGSNCSSATDWVNWKDTNRLTLGFGYRHNNFAIDLAYQYSSRKGDFYPFVSASGDYNYFTEIDGAEVLMTEEIVTDCKPVNVKDNRHQFLCTLTYTF